MSSQEFRFSSRCYLTSLKVQNETSMTKCYLLEEASSAIEMDESWESEIGQQLIKHPATLKIYESEEPVDNNLVI